MTRKALLLMFLILIFHIDLLAQPSQIIKIINVVDSLPIPGTQVSILRNDGRIKTHEITNEIGEVRLDLSMYAADDIFRVQSLGYKRISISIDSIRSVFKNKIDDVITLEPDEIILQEVYIQSHAHYRVAGDTITFNVNQYQRGNENRLEELLKNIPGFDVDNNGTISYGNKKIEQLMIDGVNFLEQGYALISKNMPVFPVSQVQVLKRFQKTKALKDLIHSENIAVNIVLKDNYRAVWFGKSHLGISPKLKDDWDFGIDGMKLGNKVKFYTIQNYNTLGYQYSAPLFENWKGVLAEETSKIELDNANIFYHIKPSLPFGLPSRFVEKQRQQLHTISTLIPIQTNWQIKLTGNYSNYKKAFEHFKISHFDLLDDKLEQVEQLKLESKETESYFSFQLLGEPSKKSEIKVYSSYQFEKSENFSDYQLNYHDFPSHISRQAFKSAHVIHWSNRLSENKAWIIQVLAFAKNQPESAINVVNNDFKEFVQIRSNQFLSDINSKWIIRSNSGKTITYTIGQIIGSEVLKSPQSYREHWFQSYLEGNFTQKLSSTISFEGHLGLHLYYNKSLLARFDSNRFGKLWLFEPRLKLIKQRTDDKRFSISYSQLHLRPNLINRVTDTIFQGNNGWMIGNADNRIGTSRIFTISFNKGSLLTGNAWQSILYLVWFKDYLSTNTWISPNKIIYEKIWTNHPFEASLQHQYDYFFDNLSSNLCFKSRFQFSKTKHLFNGVKQPWNNHLGIIYGAEWRSAFSGIFNFHLGVTRQHAIYLDNKKHGSQIGRRSQVDNEYFFDLYIQPLKQLNLTIKQFAVHFENEDNFRQWFNDLALNFQFNPKSQKLRWEVTGYNLLNEIKLNRFSRTQWGYYTSTYLIRPRQIFVKLNLQI